MPRKVISASGMPVQVATMDDVSAGDYTLPAATPTALGGVKQGDAVADSTATDAAALVTDFNSLLASLRNSGIIPE
ncbi:head fiber protein [Citrobacter sp. S2-9]|uniref:Head fiber protein n=1 Tax=Citrobacter enshiensis TaxID=2971264 RepID=A0ABT8PQW0_9ENTR|nr:head fiber protein [Citrobacter enshiensis]MDN8598633.1 head fiber protein [Citrobacter enshiensis]